MGAFNKQHLRLQLQIHLQEFLTLEDFYTWEVSNWSILSDLFVAKLQEITAELHIEDNLSPWKYIDIYYI